MQFKEYINQDLSENTLYTTPAERAAILADKSKVSDIFLYNFIGTLGLLNSIPVKGHGALINHFKQDKKVRIDQIGDDNHDISLSVKLADEAGYFKTPQTVNEITRFLFKLKSGQITEIDNVQLFKWLNDGMKPDFYRNISDARNKRLYIEYIDGLDDTVKNTAPFDVSRLTMFLKKTANKTTLSGDFKAYAKPYTLKERPYVAAGVIPVVPTVATPVPGMAPSQVQIVIPTNLTPTGRIKRKYKTKQTAALAPVVPPTFPLPGINSRSTFDGTPDPVIAPVVAPIPVKSKLSPQDIEDLATQRYKYKSPINPQLKELDEKITKIKKEIYGGDYFSEYADLNITYIKNLFISINDLMNDYTFEEVGIAKYKITSLLAVGFYNSDSFMRDYISQHAREGLIKIDPVKFQDSTQYRKSARQLAVYDQDLIPLIREQYNAKLALGDFTNTYGSSLVYQPQSYDLVDQYCFNNPEVSIEEYLKNSNDIFDKLANYSPRGIKFEDALVAELKANFTKYVSISTILNSASATIPSDVKSLYTREMFDEWAKTANTSGFYFGSYTYTNLKSVFKLTPQEILETFDKIPLGVMRKVLTQENTLVGIKDESILNYFNQASDTFNNISYVYDKDSQKRFIDLYKEHLKTLPTLTIKNKIFDTALTKTELLETADMIDFLKICRDKGVDNPFPPDDKRNRDTVTSVLSSLISDTVGTDIEDYVAEITELMPPTVINAMKANMIGLDKLKKTIEEGEIKPFATLDKARVKQILLYNKLSFAKLMKGQLPRKSKKEKWIEYLRKAAVTVKDLDVLEKPKITPDTTTNMKELNKLYVDQHHAGRHGNIYPKILKIWDCSISYPEFEVFKHNNLGDGTIIPAFHGTGGVAASMILRYGFTIIKSTDKSVAGRALGDGIYFSNKIDKTLQYATNTSNSRERSIGAKGYIFLLDVTLGTKYTHYRSAGFSGSTDEYRGFLSPEWAVFDYKAQAKILKVYEVELVRKDTYDQYMAEDTKFHGFKSYLKESPEMQQSLTTFTFYDGKIPVLIQDEMKYIDFEDALSLNLISQDMLELTADGPTIRFNTNEDLHFDVRFASAMGYNAMSTYSSLYKIKMGIS